MKKAASVIVIVLLCSSMMFVLTSKVYAQDINSGLVGYWKFDKGSGNIAVDSSGNGNNGTLINSPAWVDGVFGKALSFDGASNYVQIPDSSSLDVTANVTVAAWVYPRAYVDNAGDNPHIVSRCAANGQSIYLFGIYPNSHKIMYAVCGTGNTLVQSSAANLTLNAWTYLAITYNGSYVSLYINGTFNSGYAQSGPIQTTSNRLTIGCNSYPVTTYAYFNGTIDEVRIYNRTLSQQEIQEIMVIPEFPSFLIVPLFMMATLLAVIVHRRKTRSDSVR